MNNFNCPNTTADFANYNVDMQPNYCNFNIYQNQPAFHNPADPRLNFVNKVQCYTNYPDQKINYDLTIHSPDIEIEQKTDDELYVETWLSKIGKIQINLDSTIEIIPSKQKSIRRPKSTIKLSAAKQSLKKALNAIKKLEMIEDQLNSNVETMSSADWKKKTIDIGYLKDELTSVTGQFENNQALFLLKKSVMQRRKKRLNQKKARASKRFQYEEMKKTRTKISDDIDSWLEHKKTEVEKVKMEEKMQKDADCVLSEVTTKKSDARKQLSLISALIKLRNIRESQAIQRGEKVSLEDRSAFNKLTEKLTNMWEEMSKVYLKEEQCLKAMLETTVQKENSLQETSKSEKLINEWNYVLFGPNCVPSQAYWGLTSADKNLENFIAIRKSWDTFLVPNNDEQGSKIPIGWCLPPSNTSENWTKYLINK